MLPPAPDNLNFISGNAAKMFIKLLFLKISIFTILYKNKLNLFLYFGVNLQNTELRDFTDRPGFICVKSRKDRKTELSIEHIIDNFHILLIH